ncbi:hypothetical protein [Paraburkholderia sp. BCC1886]|uniref:hypothetical protein n=1 Tax=Paraburkholderia sp. BCC1886 TaxID=2562670 RepID=UPI001181FE6F|nr:hypothetical protein [Paraburkholderia sp. BCC1886]
MSVHLRLINQDEVFDHFASKEPIIINDLSDSSEEEKEHINNLIFTKYDLINSDLLSNIPSCQCGNTAGVDKLGDGKRYRPVVCPECHTEVTAPHQHDLEPLIWLRAPKGVSALISPIVWTMISERFEKSSFDVMRWICDITYKPAVKEPPVIEFIRKAGIPRGYNNFVDHFDEIMSFMFNLKFYNKKKLSSLKQLLSEQRDRIFSKFLPLPNRSLLVLEETNHGAYTDATAPVAVDAIRMMVGIDAPLSVHSARVKENRTIKMIIQTSQYYDETMRTVLAKKEGIFRKHVYGTRSHFSFRAVISSLTDAHHHREVHIPWGIGVAVFEVHLKNKLMRDGMTPQEAEAFLLEHANKYHPQLDAYFQMFVERSPFMGVPIVLQRNPSLARSSAQAVFITKVKTDVADPTIGMSILIVVGFNADFDGDQLNATLSLDFVTATELEKLAPHQSVFDMNAPRTVSRNLSMPKTVIATISNWMHWDVPEAADPEVVRRMALIPEAA